MILVSFRTSGTPSSSDSPLTCHADVDIRSPQKELVAGDLQVVLRSSRAPFPLPRVMAHLRRPLPRPASASLEKSELNLIAVMAFCLRPRLVLGQNSRTSSSNQN
jgi:hypothetical protein